MKIFIPSDTDITVSKRELFVLVRPFYSNGNWCINKVEMRKWGLDTSHYSLTNSIAEASLLILPFSLNHYNEFGKFDLLKEYNLLCSQNNIKGYAFISGDWGKAYPEFEQLAYFRTGGFQSQLSERNQGFPVPLSDHHLKIYGTEEILLREKQEVPVVGFCGHASFSNLKRVKENLKFIIENVKRLLQNPFRKDLEPLFPSAYHRAMMLRQLEQAKSIRTNFIYREQYRAGAISDFDLERTTLEYYNNIRNSDYIVCVRGGGNFSVRLYETLMMGRIPVFLNTDCLLPFPGQINWKQHVVWLEWRDRHQIGNRIIDFHSKLTKQEFIDLQKRNRKLWKEILSVSGLLNMIKSDVDINHKK